ncbi:hypothetical protein GCM10017788_64310 [Amycolatopsis acidiphila]|nr:hypothetical protein GCM10017788_64310 [Amycolatopsis acidiphila]
MDKWRSVSLWWGGSGARNSIGGGMGAGRAGLADCEVRQATPGNSGDCDLSGAGARSLPD